MDIFEKLLVLIVEDDGLVSLAIEDLVEEAGFAHLATRSGDGAIAELEKDAGRFSVILTDVRMPGQNSGWDVARRAREISPTMPIIYMTGDSAGEWASHGVPNSVLLQKPFADAQLVTALATLLNTQSQSPMPPSP